jgi:hypothetical protein
LGRNVLIAVDPPSRNNIAPQMRRSDQMSNFMLRLIVWYPSRHSSH